MGKHLVLAGGGHAHLLTLLNLGKIRERGHRVTVIGPSEFHYYSAMGAGMLGGAYSPEAIRFETKQGVEKSGCQFIRGDINKVDPRNKTLILETGDTISYDVVSLNVGSRVPRNILIGEGDTIFPVKPIESLIQAREKFITFLSTSEKEVVVSVVGGGPASCEIAGNLFQAGKRHGRQKFFIRIFAGNKLLDRFPDKVKNSVREILSNRGIDMVENDYVTEVKQNRVILDSAKSWPSDLTLIATGVMPVPMFKKSGLEIGPDGAMAVNRFLQNPQYPEIFGGGDCIHFKENPLKKAAVYAIRENPVLFHNLMAFMEGRPLKPFDPGGDNLLMLNMGEGIGILMKNNFFYQGRAAFLLKDFIDRRFMRKFKN